MPTSVKSHNSAQLHHRPEHKNWANSMCWLRCMWCDWKLENKPGGQPWFGKVDHDFFKQLLHPRSKMNCQNLQNKLSLASRDNAFAWQDYNCRKETRHGVSKHGEKVSVMLWDYTSHILWHCQLSFEVFRFMDCIVFVQRASLTMFLPGSRLGT